MTMIERNLNTLMAIAALFILIAASAAVAEEYAQPPIILKASNVLSKDQINGVNYKVDGKVINDGLINTYQIKTDYGTITAEGTTELMIRINEMKALKIMEKIERSGIFGESLVKGVKAPVKGAVALVTSPVETGEKVVKGAGQFMSNIGHSIVSDDPNQDNVFKVAVGYDVAKRQFAYEFGISPYSDNAPVMGRLGEIARAAVAGGIVPKAAMAAADSDLVTGMKITGAAKGMKELVRDNPPGKLADINRSKLQKMGLSSALTEAFMDNYSYDPQEKTLLIGELETMKGVKGRALMIAKANLASERSVALYNRLIAAMMAGYNVNVTAVDAIQQSAGIIYLTNKKGDLILLAPVDHLFWTKKLSDKLDKFEASANKNNGSTKKELWVTGKLDKSSRSRFKAKGWKIKENAGKVLLK
jgi:hypothetical protein